MNDLPVFYSRYIRTKIRISGDKVYSNFHGLNVPEDGAVCEFLFISMDSLIAHENKYYLKLYLNNL